MLSVVQGFGMVPLALRAALWSRDPRSQIPRDLWQLLLAWAAACPRRGEPRQCSTSMCILGSEACHPGSGIRAPGGLGLLVLEDGS